MTTKTKTKVSTSAGSKVKFQADQRFDDQKMRHYVNEACSVLHCHHYATLFTQLACDAQNLNGTTLLAAAMAETVAPILNDYYKKHDISAVEDRIAVAEQYWTFVGMGQVSFECSDGSAYITMKHSHVDEGWIKKWGVRSERVNFIGEGYVQASIGAIYGCDWKTVQARETQSIVSGASETRFDVNW